MKIINCKTNHVTDPVGFCIDTPVFSWTVTDTVSKVQHSASVTVAEDEAFSRVLYKSETNDCDGRAFPAPIDLKPRTRYYWKAAVKGDRDGVESGVNFFETGKLDEPWQARWIKPAAPLDTHPVMTRDVRLTQKPVRARAYICGLGLYEFSLNGEKVGREYFAPGFTDYRKRIQYQTYDVTDALTAGGNRIAVALGNGWYKGTFGFGEKNVNRYGSEFALLFELHLLFADGKELVVVSDDSWTAESGNITDSSFYHGEVVDACAPVARVKTAYTDLPYDTLCARRSLPVVVKDTIRPTVITAANGEKLLDFGQNMVGFVRCRFDLAKGKTVTLKFGEVLQNGNFFNANYRSARAEFLYHSDGKAAEIEPKFTSFGFRYVRTEGIADPDPADFTGCVLYSDLPDRGFVETSNDKVNRLIRNAWWGIRGNSLDIPTDCPQRDERLGWTGDCQAISTTAMYLFDMYAFYGKWLSDLGLEQAQDGRVPDFIPNVGDLGGGACAWADAATIVPWNTYVMNGDASVLRRQYASMKAWVDYISAQDVRGENLWIPVGNQYGDWLALDHPEGQKDPDFPYGFTDTAYLCSAYYRYSADLTARAAGVLGFEDDARRYHALSERVRAALYERFLRVRTPGTSTQTAYVLALAMKLAPESERPAFARLLADKIHADGDMLKTGFIGTIFALATLSENGLNDLAYTLFLREEYPGWLYAVNLGATTIWERWNSLMPDGSVNKGGMNSFNHYAYGCVLAWLFGYAAGIRPAEESPGFKRIKIEPCPGDALPAVSARVSTAGGECRSSYRYADEKIVYQITVPFYATASVRLPVPAGKSINQTAINEHRMQIRNGYAYFTLDAGAYEFAVCDERVTKDK